MSLTALGRFPACPPTPKEPISMQYSGAPQRLWKEWDGDYTRDYAGRGAWVKWMKDDLSIPIDLPGIPYDAGTTPNDSIVGTLPTPCWKRVQASSRTVKAVWHRGPRRLHTAKSPPHCSAITLSLAQTPLWDCSFRMPHHRCTGNNFRTAFASEFCGHEIRTGLPRFDASRSVYKGIEVFKHLLWNFLCNPASACYGFRCGIRRRGANRLRWCCSTSTSPLQSLILIWFIPVWMEEPGATALR